jgi:hypothetical protein
MAVRTRSVYVCDRCGMEQDAARNLRGDDCRPGGWCVIETTVTSSSERELCPTCTGAFWNWMRLP